MLKKAVKAMLPWVKSHWQICLICGIALVLLIVIVTVALVVHKRKKKNASQALSADYDSNFEIVEDIIQTDSPNIIE